MSISGAECLIDQWIRIVYNCLEDHPERLHEADYLVVTRAIVEAWPCSP